MKRYEGQSLFKHAGYSLASHCPGLAGLIVFEYVVFKQSLSRVPMAFETDTPLYPLIFFFQVLAGLNSSWLVVSKIFNFHPHLV